MTTVEPRENEIILSWLNPSTTATLGTEEIGRFRVAVRRDSTAVPKKANEGKRKDNKTISLSNFLFTKCLIQTDRIDIRAGAAWNYDIPSWEFAISSWAGGDHNITRRVNLQ